MKRPEVERFGRVGATRISVRRGGRNILEDVSLSLGAGLTAVIGPNGAGKSTLLEVLAGLLRPDSGMVTLDGAPIHQIKPKRLAQIRSFLPQSARCEWPIAVERVVALGLVPSLSPIGGLSAADEARVAATIAAWGLEEFRGQSVQTLSGGELMRVMLARALVCDPEVLLADEPIAGLDPRHALDAMARLAALGQSDRSVVVAIHDLPLAARHADSIIALNAGRLLSAGPTSQVLTVELLKELFGVQAHVEQGERGLDVRLIGGVEVA